MEDRKKFEMNEQELETAAGGTETNSLLHGTGYYMTVQVEKNYLVYVYDPKTGQYGYTNCNYLIDPQTGRRGVSNPLGF